MPTSTQDWQDKLDHKAKTKGWDLNLSQKQHKKKVEESRNINTGITPSLKESETKKTIAPVIEANTKPNSNPFSLLEQDD